MIISTAALRSLGGGDKRVREMISRQTAETARPMATTSTTDRQRSRPRKTPSTTRNPTQETNRAATRVRFSLKNPIAAKTSSQAAAAQRRQA